jgi:hypothetical protein
MHLIRFVWEGIAREIELKPNEAYIALNVLENVGYRIAEVRERKYGYHERIYIMEEIENGK